MGLIDGIRNYILDEEFRITVYKNKINVINYDSITTFSSNEVIIKYDDGEVVISGNDLAVSRLLIDEVLITGKIEKVELR